MEDVASGASPASRSLKMLVGMLLSSTILGLALPFAVVRAALEEAYQGGPVFSWAALAAVWAALLLTSLVIGLRARRFPLARGLFVGAIFAVASLLVVLTTFYVRNQ